MEVMRERGYQMFETVLDWQQQALKAGLVSTEMVRIAGHHRSAQL
jgi:hypothetical protein